MKRALLVVALDAATAVSGCSGRGRAGDVNDAGRRVTATDIQPWPLTVHSGVLNCHGSNGLGSATVTINGAEYGLNGTALDHGYPKVDPIWKKAHGFGVDPRVYIGGMIDAALELCK